MLSSRIVKRSGCGTLPGRYREKLDVRLTATTVQIFHKGEKVAAHARSYVRGTHTTKTYRDNQRLKRLLKKTRLRQPAWRISTTGTPGD
jgi:hypothetical protein